MPADQALGAPLPEIHVTHDRKQHRSAAAIPQDPPVAENAPPRKATSADFLASFAAAAPAEAVPDARAQSRPQLSVPRNETQTASEATSGPSSSVQPSARAGVAVQAMHGESAQRVRHDAVPRRDLPGALPLDASTTLAAASPVRPTQSGARVSVPSFPANEAGRSLKGSRGEAGQAAALPVVADDADQPGAATLATAADPAPLGRLLTAGRDTAKKGIGHAVSLPAPSHVAPGEHVALPANLPAAVAARVPTVEDEVLTPEIGLPALLDHRGRLIVPPAMKGTHDILVHQNVMADADGLDRILDDADLERMRAVHLLVALPVSAAIGVDDRLPANRRYARPWTVLFLNDLARAHAARFHLPLQVNSAVRTVEFQQRLIRTNGNAAPAEGATASPHLTGQAVDIAKKGLSMAEIAWMRGYLLPLVQEGKIDVEEEFQQACFHISVYRRYHPLPVAPDSVHGRGLVKGLATAIE